MDLDVGAQRAAELLNCLTVVTFTSNKYHVLHGTRAIPTLECQGRGGLLVYLLRRIGFISKVKPGHAPYGGGEPRFPTRAYVRLE